MRLRTHFSNYKHYNKEDFWRKHIRYFSYAELSKIDADIYEIYLINKHKPKYNNQFSYKKTSTIIELEPISFTEIKSVEDIGIDVDYYTEIYDKMSKEIRKNNYKYNLSDYRDLINNIEEEIYKDIYFLENKIKNSDQKYKLRDLIVFQLVVHCGLTTSEIVDLKRNDFDPDRKTIYVSNRDLKVPMPSKLVKNISKLYEDYNYNFDNKRIIKSQMSDSISSRSLQLIIKKYFDDITIRKLRNLFILKAVKISNDFELLSEMISISKRSIYKYLNKENEIGKKLRKNVS